MPSVFPLVVVIVSGIVYHLAQKASGGGRPWRMLAVAYGAAFALALVLAFLNADPGRGAAGREKTAGLLLGLAAFGIEAGFFFIYRSGWQLASASVIANITCTAVLAVIGILFFREHMTAARAAGLALSAAGATLIARG